MSENAYRATPDENPNPWKDAACVNDAVDPDWFHDPDKNVQAWAVEICSECPLRTACLKEALDRNYTEGVWGGLTPEDRRIIKQFGDINQLKKGATQNG
jgi:WhiB family redox-sensing transcriptional regulator